MALRASHVLLWIAVMVQAVILIAVMRQVGTLLLRVGSSKAFDAGWGPQIGDLAPWTPESLSGGEDDRLGLMAFVSTACGACDLLVPALNAVARDYQDRLRVVMIARESEEASLTWAHRLGVKTELASSQRAFDAFSVEGTPYVFVLDPGGRVQARGGVNHIDHLESMLRRCMNGAHQTNLLTLEKGPVPS